MIYMSSNKEKEPSNILVRRYIVARIYVTISILFSVLSAIFEYSQIKSVQVPFFLLYTAVGICIIGLIDVFINDICPNNYTLKYSYDNRHLIYMGLSLVSFSLSAGILLSFGGSVSIARMWLDGAVSALVAVLDIFARHRGFSWRTTSFP